MSVLPSMPPVVWTAPGVPTLGVSPVVLVWDAGIVRQGAALHSIGVVETLATPGVGKKTLSHYCHYSSLPRQICTTHKDYHYTLHHSLPQTTSNTTTISKLRHYRYPPR